jgi:hypothetical protein
MEPKDSLLRAQHYTTGHYSESVESCSYSHILFLYRTPLYPQEDSWYSFLLEADSTPRTIVRLEGLGKFNNSTSSGTRTGDL